MRSQIIIFLFQYYNFCNDEYFEIRVNAYHFLSYILKIKYSNIAEEKLFEFEIDCSPFIKNNIIFLCMKGFINWKISNKLKRELIKDVNYEIKINANLINN